MKLFKLRSKPVSKVIDIIYYSECPLAIFLKKTHNDHMNEGQNKDF
jgi:hypothetical protein